MHYVSFSLSVRHTLIPHRVLFWLWVDDFVKLQQKMSEPSSALKTAALVSTPGLFTSNMCTACTAEKDINTVMLCLAYRRPIRFHLEPNPTNSATAAWAQTANRCEACGTDATEMQQTFYWTTKCVVNQIVPLQNNTTPYWKVQSGNCTSVYRTNQTNLSRGWTVI